MAHAQANSYGNRSRDRVTNSEPVRNPASIHGPWYRGQAAPEAKPFEQLVTDKNDVESCKYVPGHCKGEANENRVVDHTKLEYKNSSELGWYRIFGGSFSRGSLLRGFQQNLTESAQAMWMEAQNKSNAPVQIA